MRFARFASVSMFIAGAYPMPPFFTLPMCALSSRAASESAPSGRGRTVGGVSTAAAQVRRLNPDRETDNAGGHRGSKGPCPPDRRRYLPQGPRPRRRKRLVRKRHSKKGAREWHRPTSSLLPSSKDAL